MKDTREAWERAGQGGRVDRRSLAERRDEAERAGDLEQAAELSRKPNVHLGPQAYRGRSRRRSGVLADLEREGLIERIKERIAGIYRELQALPGTWRRRWRHEISGLNWRNRPATTVQPEHGPRPQLALVYRIQQALGHFMDNEDTRVPTVHIESGGPIIDDTQLEHWSDPMANIDPAAHPRPTNSHTTPSPSSIGFSKLRDTFMDNEDRLSLLSIKV